MSSKVIATLSVPGFEVESWLMNGEILHRIRIVGRVGLKERLPMYQSTLEINRAHGKMTYFCVLDNQDRHENTMSFEDIKQLDQMLLENGVTEFFGATITTDVAYASLVSLADASSKAADIGGELMATSVPAEAEVFILEKIAAHASCSISAPSPNDGKTSA